MLKPPSNHSDHHNIPNPFPAITNPSPISSAISKRNVTQPQHRPSQSPQINTLAKQSLSSKPVITPSTPVTSNPSRTYASPYNRSAPNYQLQYRTQIQTPFPIINQNEKKFLDKILDFLIGDGQSNQYGMVCKECYGHNGT